MSYRACGNVVLHAQPHDGAARTTSGLLRLEEEGGATADSQLALMPTWLCLARATRAQGLQETAAG